MREYKSKKLLAIVGPTASGKSDIAVELAKEFDGEIISADSRQVYTELDVGTAKISQEEMRGIPHHLLDIIEPGEKITVTEYKHLADKTIDNIHNKGQLPFLVGGTGFYIQAVVDDVTPPPVPPDHNLREKLEKYDIHELQDQLRTLDPERYQTIQQDNKRRLIRAIEITTHLGHVPKISKGQARYDALQIGLSLSPDELRNKINTRTKQMVSGGLIEETEFLLKKGLSEKDIQELGFEYSLTQTYINNEFSKQELVEKIQNKTWQYAKRQQTWFKRDDRIHWFSPHETDSISSLVSNWLHT